MEAPLKGYRALDLCDDRGIFCGRILADLGVEVIQIERPEGSPVRSKGPFCRKRGGSELLSLYWLCFAANKKGITLNIETKDGQEILKRLIKRSDFIIESFDPGYMSLLGLDYKEISLIKPDIIMTSITPFGQEGPYRDYSSSDLICWSLGGYTWITGDPDRPPVHISFPQAYLQGGAEGAVATLIAHYYRTKTGKGQYVDVSIQASVTRNLMNAPLFYEINNEILKRAGNYRVGLSIEGGQKTHWECKDGYVAFFMFGGHIGASINRALVEYMDEEGMAPEFMKGIEWEKFDMATASREVLDSFSHAIGAFFKKHTRKELYLEAIRRNMTLYPLNTVKDIYEDPQLKERGFWERVYIEGIGEVDMPGSPVRLSETPCDKRIRAPFLGEHNYEIYGGELGFTDEEISSLKERGVI
jgi:crotonobetainyl-CoA:carnitine CoA-transferase CaiB-like acyl-CoA transferase